MKTIAPEVLSMPNSQSVAVCRVRLAESAGENRKPLSRELYQAVRQLGGI